MGLHALALPVTRRRCRARPSGWRRRSRRWLPASGDRDRAPGAAAGDLEAADASLSRGAERRHRRPAPATGAAAHPGAGPARDSGHRPLPRERVGPPGRRGGACGWNAAVAALRQRGPLGAVHRASSARPGPASCASRPPDRSPPPEPTCGVRRHQRPLETVVSRRRRATRGGAPRRCRPAGAGPPGCAAGSSPAAPASARPCPAR